MSVLRSDINPASEAFRNNQAAFDLQMEAIETALREILSGSGKKKGGKLPVRVRIDRLLDPGSPFVEVGQFGAHGMYGGTIYSGGIVTGIGMVSGRLVMVVANDGSVKGGTYYPITIRKHIRAQQVARENGLPCIYLVDSGGAFLPLQDEIFPDENQFGTIFRNIAEMSALGLPQIAAVMGSCTAGGAYIPAMCDETVIVSGTGTIFLGGPQLVQAATGVKIDAESLGGADLHTTQSAVADHLAHDDEHALRLVRDIVARSPGAAPAGSPLAPEEPLYDPAELPGLISANPREPIRPREILARILDGSRFDEYRARWGTTIICGTGAIGGYPVGVLINDGVLFSEGAQKAANFIEICCQRNIPLVFFHNISGFMVGQEYEADGIARHGAKMVNAVSCAAVPKFSVMIGGSYGAGNFAMCGRAFGPRMMAMWPNARTSVMGGEQAATVLALVREAQLNNQGEEFDPEAQAAFKEPILERYEECSHPLYAAARMWVDSIITPQQTRDWLGLGLAMAAGGPSKETRFGVLRI